MHIHAQQLNLSETVGVKLAIWCFSSSRSWTKTPTGAKKKNLFVFGRNKFLSGPRVSGTAARGMRALGRYGAVGLRKIFVIFSTFSNHPNTVQGDWGPSRPSDPDAPEGPPAPRRPLWARDPRTQKKFFSRFGLKQINIRSLGLWD